MTQLRRRKAAGEPLTADEEAQVAGYYRQYSKQKPSLHLARQTAELYAQEARASGMPFSAWARLQIEKGRRGDSDLVVEVRQENDKLRTELSGLRAAQTQLHIEGHQMRQRLEDTEGRLLDALETVLSMKKGEQT